MPTITELLKDGQVSHTMAAITKKGCVVPAISIVDCMKATKHSGSLVDGQISLCQEPEELQVTTLRHELIHAYDGCPTPIDLTDCKSVACSEVRAASLSGECDFLMEMRRGRFGGFRDCVKRRAGLSVSMHGFKVDVNDCIESVFDECINNKSPF